jgi:serine/threonine-protein kinase HipA
MAINKTDIFVYAHWLGMNEPKLIGILSAHQGKGRKLFSFEYEKEWLKSNQSFLLDPDIQYYAGPQFPVSKENFGIFLDSMPDTWGRTLMKRRASAIAKEQGKSPSNLYEIDFLLGVYDESRMGALRFKLDPKGDFLDNTAHSPTPPWSSVGQLQHAVDFIESDKDNDEVQKWLAQLIAPGSSLGGARPKANIIDEHKHLWIAKFPSKNDTIDKAAWEYLSYQLALKAGINMSESKMSKVSGKYNTFFTKRFDRIKSERIHFASAMTMTGNNEDILKNTTASYLDIAEVIQQYGANIKEDLAQLWKRIIFNILISNTDDHLRNHGFILSNKGWRLSPAYDINPSVDKNGLSLNIDIDNNDLDIELAKSVGEYFRLNMNAMNNIILEVAQAVNQWEVLANKIGISRIEQEIMRAAFKSNV